jgi:hypothetical protein
VDDVLAVSASPDVIMKSIQERFKLKDDKYGLFGSPIIENDESQWNAMLDTFFGQIY